MCVWFSPNTFAQFSLQIQLHSSQSHPSAATIALSLFIHHTYGTLPTAFAPNAERTVCSSALWFRTSVAAQQTRCPYINILYCLPRAPPTSNGPRFEVSCVHTDSRTVRHMLLHKRTQLTQSNRIVYAKLCSVFVYVSQQRDEQAYTKCTHVRITYCLCWPIAWCVRYSSLRDACCCVASTLTQPSPPLPPSAPYSCFIRGICGIYLSCYFSTREIGF